MPLVITEADTKPTQSLSRESKVLGVEAPGGWVLPPPIEKDGAELAPIWGNSKERLRAFLKSGFELPYSGMRKPFVTHATPRVSAPRHA